MSDAFSFYNYIVIHYSQSSPYLGTVEMEWALTMQYTEYNWSEKLVDLSHQTQRSSDLLLRFFRIAIAFLSKPCLKYGFHTYDSFHGFSNM